MCDDYLFIHRFLSNYSSVQPFLMTTLYVRYYIYLPIKGDKSEMWWDHTICISGLGLETSHLSIESIILTRNSYWSSHTRYDYLFSLINSWKIQFHSVWIIFLWTMTLIHCLKKSLFFLWCWHPRLVKLDNLIYMK